MAKATNSVIISVEFRQGAFGWLSLPALKTGDAEEDSGNYAMLDIRLALQWVQKNAVHFGGNAKNVTLAGFSAGGRDVMLCVISPIMKGLFHKAIVFSGGMVTSSYIAREVGADHGSAVNFLLGSYVCRYDYLQNAMYKKSNLEGREALTKKMKKYVKHFLRQGTPGGKWKQWKKSKKVKKMIVFNASNKKTKIHMTSKTIQLKKVLKNMKQSLSQYIYITS